MSDTVEFLRRFRSLLPNTSSWLVVQIIRLTSWLSLLNYMQAQQKRCERYVRYEDARGGLDLVTPGAMQSVSLTDPDSRSHLPNRYSDNRPGRCIMTDLAAFSCINACLPTLPTYIQAGIYLLPFQVFLEAVFQKDKMRTQTAGLPYSATRITPSGRGG